MIWKESKELGVAFAKSGGKIVVVANYYPPGNIIGQFAQNVPAPQSYLTNNNHIELSKNLTSLSSKLSSITLTRQTHSKLSCSFTEGNFEEDFLEAHNRYRRRHGVPPLKLDRKLSKYSEEWANYLAQRNTLEHRPCSNYGENIYCLYSSDPNFKVNGHTPVDTWYEEVAHHPFGKEPSSLRSGHFSQVIWKSSEYLGLGVAKNTQGSIYIVANYSPAGNFVGHYVENVPPVKPAYYDEMSQSKECFMKSSRSERSEKSRGSVPSQKSSRVDNSMLDTNTFAIDALKVHNEYRRRHGVSDLVLSANVSINLI